MKPPFLSILWQSQLDVLYPKKVFEMGLLQVRKAESTRTDVQSEVLDRFTQ